MLPKEDVIIGDTPYYAEPTEEELVLMGDIPAGTESAEIVEPLMGAADFDCFTYQTEINKP